MSKSKEPEKIKVEWKSIDIGEWEWFELIETYPHGWLKMRGVDSPCGKHQHRGDVLMAHKDDIKSIEFLA